MSKYLIDGDTLADIANAIRARLDTVADITPVDMPLDIMLIEGDSEAAQIKSFTLASATSNLSVPGSSKNVLVLRHDAFTLTSAASIGGVYCPDILGGWLVFYRNSTGTSMNIGRATTGRNTVSRYGSSNFQAGTYDYIEF